MKNIINKWFRVSLSLAAMLLFTCTIAQTTVNLTEHEGSVPSGYTIKWFTDINHTTEVSDKSAVGEGTYYAFLDKTGASPVCLTGPATLKVLAIACGASSIDLSANISASTTPSGATLTFHNNVNPTEANQLSGTDITAAVKGKYYVSFRTGATSANYCYSNSTPVLVINQNCPLAQDDINQTPKGFTVSGSVITNDTNISTTNPVLGATYMISNSTMTAMPIGTATNVYGRDSSGAIVLAGSMTLNADGTYTYVPTTEFVGDVPLTYTAKDDNGKTDTAILIVKVLDKVSETGNNPPIAQDDTATVQTNTSSTTNSVSVNVLSNDSDVDGDALGVSNVEAITSNDGVSTSAISTDSTSPTTVYDRTGKEAGTAYLDSTGKVVFTPSVGYTGKVPFRTTIDDGNGGTSISKLIVTVTPQSETEEVYANDDSQVFKAGTPLVSGNVLTNDSNSGLSPISVTSANVNGTSVAVGTETDLGLGKLTLNSDGSYTFKPAESFTGTVSVVYTSCIGVAPNQICKQATLYLTSTPSDVCTAAPFTTGTDFDTPIGISTLERNTENWITDKNAFIKLESKTLGFIPTKMTTSQRDALTAVQGMVIWNTDTECLEYHDGTSWKCAKKGCNK